MATSIATPPSLTPRGGGDINGSAANHSLALQVEVLHGLLAYALEKVAQVQQELRGGTGASELATIRPLSNSTFYESQVHVAHGAVHELALSSSSPGATSWEAVDNRLAELERKVENPSRRIEEQLASLDQKISATCHLFEVMEQSHVASTRYGSTSMSSSGNSSDLYETLRGGAPPSARSVGGTLLTSPGSYNTQVYNMSTPRLDSTVGDRNRSLGTPSVGHYGTSPRSPSPIGTTPHSNRWAPSDGNDNRSSALLSLLKSLGPSGPTSPGAKGASTSGAVRKRTPGAGTGLT